MGVGEIIGRRKFNKMCQDLQSRKRHIYLKAARDLSKSRNPRALEPLIEYCKRWRDSEPDYSEAMHAIGEIGGLQALLPLLSDEFPTGAIRYAAFVIGKIGDPRTVEPLIKL